MEKPTHSTTEEFGSQLPLDHVELCSILSLDASKRNPIHFLSSDVVLLFCGSTLVLFNLNDLKQEYIWGRDGGGIGAVAMHPSRTLFCVAEKSCLGSPNAYIYEYPALEIVKTLRNGTEHAYSAAAFNLDGGMLATVRNCLEFLGRYWSLIKHVRYFIQG